MSIAVSPTPHSRAQRPEQVDPFPSQTGIFWTPEDHERAKESILARLQAARRALPIEARGALEETTGRVRRMYEDYEQPDKGVEGSRYGFMVANRNEAVEEGALPGPDYSSEVRDYMPELGPFLDRNGCAKLLVGLPPNVVDHLGENGEAGLLVFTPISTGAAIDFGIREHPGKDWQAFKPFLDAHFGRIATAAAEFTAKKTGRGGVIGLGAVLPKYTNMGRSIDAPGVHTTTGHAGTLAAIKMTVEKVREQMFNGELPNGHIGVLGAGSIGFAAAIELHRMYPERIISVVDSRPHRSELVAKAIGRDQVEIHESADSLFDQTKVVVSALTSPLDPANLTSRAEGVVIIDDSEPKCISNEDAERLGVRIVGVTVTGDNALLKRNAFNYGGWTGQDVGEVFACQAEAAMLHRVIGDGRYPADICIRDDVRAEDIHLLERLFLEGGISAARLQDSQGRLYSLAA